jgi:O-antigen ligase
MLLTVSRSALLAAGGVALAVILLFNKLRGLTRVVSYGAFIALVLSFVFIPTQQLLRVLPGNLAARFESVDTSFKERQAIWFDTWDMFADHPATGVGPGSFQAYLMQTRPTIANFYGIGAGSRNSYIPDQPENGYLEILYEGGLIGCAAFAVVVIDLLRRVFGIAFAKKAKDEDRTDVIAAFAALVAYGISFITLFSFRIPQLCALVLLAFAVIWRRTTPSLEEKARPAVGVHKASVELTANRRDGRILGA